jgi:hypothetical protein
MTPWQMLRLLRWPIALALVLVSVGLSALLYAQRAHDQAHQQMELSLRENLLASTQLRQAIAQESEVHDAIAQYETLRRRGLIGPERRLAWVEALDATRQRLRIDTLNYEILPQRPLEGSASTPLTWMESRMRLSVELRHAGLLVDMIESLQNEPSAIVQPRQCRLSRASDPAGVEAECELRWLTLRTEVRP